MTISKTSISFKTIYLAIAAIMVIFLLNACATKARFQNSTVVPAAEGTVKVKKDNNQNYEIKISLANLAEPNRLTPPKHMYVVWMESPSSTYPQNLGMINSSTGFLSNRLTASFETISSTKPTRIFITAEDEATPSYHSSVVVLTTDRF